MAEAKCNSYAWKVDAHYRQIMAVPVHTLDGLRAKAVAAIHMAGPRLWDGSVDDADWDKKGVRALIEAVCTLTGLDIPVEISA